MRYTVNARAQSIITAALAVVLAIVMQLGAAARGDPAHPSASAHAAPAHIR